MKLDKIHWDDVPVEKVTPQMERKLVYGEKIMIARMKFKDGFEVPLHHHESEQISQVLSGTVRFWFGKDKEETMDLHAGETVVIPSNVPHAAIMIGDVEGIDTWSPIREDWLDGSDDYLRK